MSGLPELAGQGFNLRLVQAAAYGVEEYLHALIPGDFFTPWIINQCLLCGYLHWSKMMFSFIVKIPYTHCVKSVKLIKSSLLSISREDGDTPPSLICWEVTRVL
jgi:hypothetical protein